MKTTWVTIHQVGSWQIRYRALHCVGTEDQNQDLNSEGVLQIDPKLRGCYRTWFSSRGHRVEGSLKREEEAEETMKRLFPTIQLVDPLLPVSSTELLEQYHTKKLSHA